MVTGWGRTGGNNVATPTVIPPGPGAEKLKEATVTTCDAAESTNYAAAMPTFHPTTGYMFCAIGSYENAYKVCIEILVPSLRLQVAIKKYRDYM